MAPMPSIIGRKSISCIGPEFEPFGSSGGDCSRISPPDCSGGAARRSRRTMGGVIALQEMVGLYCLILVMEPEPHVGTFTVLHTFAPVRRAVRPWFRWVLLPSAGAC